MKALSGFSGGESICNQPRSNYVYVRTVVAAGKYDADEQTKIEFQFAVLQRIFIYHQLSE